MDYWEKRDLIVKRINTGELNKMPYGTTGTYGYYDIADGKWYNDSGQELRSPEEYHADPDSYYENQDYDN